MMEIQFSHDLPESDSRVQQIQKYEEMKEVRKLQGIGWKDML